MNRLRSPESYPIAFLVFLLLLGALAGAWGFSRHAALTAIVPTPTSAVTVSATPAVAASATPSPQTTPAAALAADGLRVFAVGAIPADHRFVLVGDAGDERLLLLDLAGRRVIEAAHFEGSGAFAKDRQVEITSRASGELFVILLRADGPNARVYLIHPVTGDVRALTIPKSEQPRLSPDGASLAVARDTDDDAVRGLWLVNVADGAMRRVVASVAGTKAPRPLQWSADGRWLAVLSGAETFETRVALIDPARGSLETLGPGTGARWRGADVLFWSARAPGGVSAFDTTVRQARLAYPAEPGVTVDRAEPRPGSTDIATLERGATATATQIILHGTQRAAALVSADASNVIALWWAADGARLYVWSNDNGTTTVADAISKSTAVTFCLRQRVAPPCS